MPSLPSPVRRLLSAALVLAALSGAPAARAAAVTSLRLAQVGKSDATIALRLDAPAAAEVSWGENPGEWTDTARAEAPDSQHQLQMTKLVPDTRYFYQVSVDGQPASDMLTFRSGRSWVTRRAAILVTADAPQGAPGESEQAERLFAEESDALIVLGGTPIDEDALARLHARSMAEKVVTHADDATSARLAVADVIAISDGVLPSTDDGTCWRLALGPRAPAGADVVVTRGANASIASEGDVVRITLADPEEAAAGSPAPPRAHARLDFAEGRLSAVLVGPSGETLGKAELQRACRTPAPKAPAAAVHSDDGDEPGTSEGEAEAGDCDVK